LLLALAQCFLVLAGVAHGPAVLAGGRFGLALFARLLGAALVALVPRLALVVHEPPDSPARASETRRSGGGGRPELLGELGPRDVAALHERLAGYLVHRAALPRREGLAPAARRRGARLEALALAREPLEVVLLGDMPQDSVAGPDAHRVADPADRKSV